MRRFWEAREREISDFLVRFGLDEGTISGRCWRA